MKKLFLCVSLVAGNFLYAIEDAEAHAAYTQLITAIVQKYESHPLVSALQAHDVARVRTLLAQKQVDAREQYSALIDGAKMTCFPIILALLHVPLATAQERDDFLAIVQELVRAGATPQDAAEFEMGQGGVLLKSTLPASLMALLEAPELLPFFSEHGMNVHSILFDGRKLVEVAHDIGASQAVIDLLTAEMARQPEPELSIDDSIRRMLYQNPEEFKKAAEVFTELMQKGELRFEDLVDEQPADLWTLQGALSSAWSFVYENMVPLLVGSWIVYEFAQYLRHRAHGGR